MKKILTIFVLLPLMLMIGKSALAGGSEISGPPLGEDERWDCIYTISDLKNLRNYSFMGRVDPRILKKSLGSKYTDFESKCLNESRLDSIAYDYDSCDEDFVLDCTSSDEDFTRALFYADLHQKANRELLKIHPNMYKEHAVRLNKSCTAGDAESLEENIKAAMGAAEPVKKEQEMLVDVYSEWRCSSINPLDWECGYYYVNVWETFSGRSTWANEHICMVGADEFDTNGDKRATYWVKDWSLMVEKYDGTGNVTVPATAAIEDIYKEERALDTSGWWCNTGSTSKCVIRKRIEMTDSLTGGDKIDELMNQYKPKDYLKGYIWPFEFDVVLPYNTGCREHRIYPATNDGKREAMVVKECVKDASPNSLKYLDLVDYHPVEAYTKKWHAPFTALLRTLKASASEPPFRTESEGYYVCYKDKCLVQYHAGKNGGKPMLDAVVKVHQKEKEWRIELIPQLTGGHGGKEDIQEEAGAFYYGLKREKQDDDTYLNSIVRIIPAGKPEAEISCEVNGQEVTKTDKNTYSLKPSEYEKITVAADANNVEVTCTITLNGSLQFSTAQADTMNLWLDIYEDSTDKYECDKVPGYIAARDGCSEEGGHSGVDMSCLWCSYHNKTLEFEGEPVDTGKPQELEVSVDIPKEKISSLSLWGKAMGLLSTQIIKVNGWTSTSVAMNNGAMYRKTFAENIAFVEEGHFICDDGKYAESCTCDSGKMWDTTSGTCVPDCGIEAKWSIDDNECACSTVGYNHNSYSNKCYDPTICDNIKNGAEYNEETDQCACLEAHMAVKGSECACDAANHWVNDGDGGCKCAGGYEYSTNSAVCVASGQPEPGDCSSDSDCDDDELCKDGACVGNEPEPLGGGCKTNGDCDTGMVCSPATNECECDIDNNFYAPYAGAKICEYKEPAIDAICTIGGGIYISSEGYCEYNKDIATCKTTGGKWEGGQCNKGEPEPVKGGGCTLVPGMPAAVNMGTVLAYLTMLGSILLVRVRKRDCFNG